jgi:hypothetical protein
MPSAHGRGNASTLAASPAKSPAKAIREREFPVNHDPIVAANAINAIPVTTAKVLLQ